MKFVEVAGNKVSWEVKSSPSFLIISNHGEIGFYFYYHFYFELIEIKD